MHGQVTNIVTYSLTGSLQAAERHNSKSECPESAGVIEQDLCPAAYLVARSRASHTSRNRGRLDIIADVINACKERCTKSYIMLKANVNSVTATQLIEKLVSCGLITATEEDGSMLFFPTARGVEFLLNYERLLVFLDQSGMGAEHGGIHALV